MEKALKKIQHDATFDDELDADDSNVTTTRLRYLPSIDELVCADDEVRQICDSVYHEEMTGGLL